MKQTDEQKKFSTVFNRVFNTNNEDGRDDHRSSKAWLIVNTKLEGFHNKSLFSKIIDGIIITSLDIRSIRMDTSILLTKHIHDTVDFIANNFSEDQAKKLTPDEIGFITANIIPDTTDSKSIIIIYFEDIIDVIRKILDDGILYTDEEF